MKKNGFTLAEILVTLGIVGVVSAITMPTLISNNTKAQIGPKLAKAVSSFEQANLALLNANSVDALSDARILNKSKDSYYINELAKYIKMSYSSSSNSSTFKTRDGFAYTIDITNAVPDNVADPVYKQRVGDVVIDIDGANNGVNADATDIFYFSMWNDGSLSTKGATDWDGTADSADGGKYHWSTQCDLDALPADETYCAGHIFENNMKVLYK